MLILSMLALFAGPLLYQWLSRGGRLARTVDRLIVAALVVVVGVLLVPETLSELGLLALVLIAVGYAAPLLLELLLKQAAHTMHIIALLVALGGLSLHAMLDGAGLAGSSHQHSDTLGLAIVLHRFGVGLVLWLMVQPVLGRSVAVATLVVVALATLAGYLLSEPLLGLEAGQSVHVIQAIIIGTIIHSLVHRGHAHEHSRDEA